MPRTWQVLALMVLSSLDTTVAFAPAPFIGVQLATASIPKPSTCLGSSSEESPAEDHSLPSEASSDILNSPAFLKRKLEVLQSDIEKCDQGIAAAKERLEAGKLEWGGQLDELQKEVSDDDVQTTMMCDFDASMTCKLCISMAFFLIA